MFYLFLYVYVVWNKDLNNYWLKVRFFFSIWGIMAYQEFTRTGNLVKAARDLARKLDPMIGDYEYHSFNPETKEYEKGYVPLGPIDFWDKETHAPSWLDKGKYWHILLG